VLSGIRRAPKGEPEIEVSFDIDANGIVSVGARDLATGKEQSITVSSTGTLSDTEIGEIIREHDLYEVELKG
jgi:molecular chaperone DnaK